MNGHYQTGAKSNFIAWLCDIFWLIISSFWFVGIKDVWVDLVFFLLRWKSLGYIVSFVLSWSKICCGYVLACWRKYKGVKWLIQFDREWSDKDWKYVVLRAIYVTVVVCSIKSQLPSSPVGMWDWIVSDILIYAQICLFNWFLVWT